MLYTDTDIAQSQDLQKAVMLEAMVIAHAIVGDGLDAAKRLDDKYLVRAVDKIALQKLRLCHDQTQAFAALSDTASTDKAIIDAISEMNRVPVQTAIAELKALYLPRGELELQHEIARTIDTAARARIYADLASLLSGRDVAAGNDGLIVIDMAHRSKPIEFCVEMGDALLCPKREMTCIKGHAKHGKTQLVSLITAAILGNGRAACGLKAHRNDMTMLYVDTEQSQFSTEYIVEKALRMAELPTDGNCPRLTAINMRKTPKTKRKDIIEDMVSRGNYDIVIVDGIKDLCLDFNDLKEADQLMVDILAMIEANDIAFVTVLHENPSGDTSKMRGHLGTEAENKAFSVYQSKKKDEIYNVINTECRMKPTPTFAFHFNDDDELEECEPNIEENKTTSQSPQGPTKEEKQRNQFLKAWEDNTSLSLTELEIINALAKKCDMKRSTVQRRIEYFEAKGVIECDDPEHGKGARYGLTPQTRTELAQKAYLEQQDEGQLPF